MVRTTVALLFAAVAIVGPARAVPEGRAPAPTGPLLGFVGDQHLRLVPIERQGLQPVAGKGIGVRRGGCAPREGGSACWNTPPWALATGGMLAVAENDDYDSAGIRLVDAATLRTIERVKVEGGPIGAVAWFGPRRLLAVQEVCCSERDRLLAIDIGANGVRARVRLGGTVVRLAWTPDGLVMLVAPARAVGAARLVVATGDAIVRTLRLDRITAGLRLLPGPGHRVDERLPGLAVDPAAGRVLVVGRESLAVVDLHGLSVTYRRLEPSASGRRHTASVVRREKATTGYVRQAERLTNGRVAVSGEDSTPLGLVLVDPGSWQARLIDEDATGFFAAGRLLLATGSSRDGAMGLAGYDFGGGLRFHLFDGSVAWVDAAFGGRAYVGVVRPNAAQEPVRVVELATGRLLGERRQPVPSLLLGRGSSWWGSL